MDLNTNSSNSDFEHIWVEAILTRGVLSQAELIVFLKHFGLGSFGEYSGDNEGILEMVYAALNEVPADKLFEEARRLIDEGYPDRMSFEEAEDVFNILSGADRQALSDFYTIALHKDKIENADEHDLILCILGELYKLPKEKAESLVKALEA